MNLGIEGALKIIRKIPNYNIEHSTVGKALRMIDDEIQYRITKKIVYIDKVHGLGPCCAKCGYVFPVESNFCPECGQKASWPTSGWEMDKVTVARSDTTHRLDRKPSSGRAWRVKA